MESKKTGYPSIDKPWMKYYTDNNPDVQFPSGSVYDYLYQCNCSALDDIALIYFNRKVTYKQLFEYINRTAEAFLKMGVKKGDIVVLALPNIPENIYCFYALNRIGAIADFVDLRIKGDVLSSMLLETRARVAVICNLYAQNYYDVKETNIEKMIVVSPYDSLNPLIKIAKDEKISLRPNAIWWKDFLTKDVYKSEPNGDPEADACIFHTSGTTGRSKGALFSNSRCNAMSIQADYVPLKFEYGKRMMNQVPPFLAFNILCSLHLPLTHHMQMVLLPDYRPDQFASRIINTKATACLAGPADWGNFLEDKKSLKKKITLKQLVTPLSGSDALSEKTMEQINSVLKSKGCDAQIYEGYGMTEIGSAACANMPDIVKAKSVGIPFFLNSFCIWDNDSGSELTYGELGEICMSGPTLMKEYYNNDEETQKALRTHKDGQIWLHSGDLGYIDEDGFVFISGRLKRIIVNHEGFKISPFEIEKVLLSNNAVEACCVVAVKDNDAGMGHRPFAFVVTKNGESITADELSSFCQQKLVETYRPVGYRFLSSLPLTDNGKVDYRTLEEMAKEGELDE